MYSVSELRKGVKIEFDGEPWVVTDFEFTKPGKGQAIYRCKLKNLISGNTLDRSWRSNDSFERADLSERDVIYVYKEGDVYVFSDEKSFEEIRVPASLLGNRVHFLVETAECKILFFKERPVEVTLQVFIEKKIVQTEPAVRGDTATNVTKPAKIDTGYEIAVPLFINQGDIVRIDTRTGQYADRVKKA